MAGMKALGDLWAGPTAPRGHGWIDELFAAANAGEPRAKEVITQVGTLLGMATTNLALVLDPSLIVFGGPLLASGSPLLHETRRIVARIIPSPPEMLASELGHDATLWGCLLTAANEARDRMRDGLRSKRA